MFASSLLQSQTRLKSHSDIPGHITTTTITIIAAATTTTVNNNPAAADITTINSTGSNNEEYTIRLPSKYVALLQAACNICQN